MFDGVFLYRDSCFLNFKISKFSAFEFGDEPRNRLNDWFSKI
jgi:hypothetical protein